MSTFATPPAQMGFTGFFQVEIDGIASSTFSRGTSTFQPRLASCNLKLQQAVNFPNNVTSAFDRMVATFQTEIIEGDIEYNIIAPQGGNDPTPHLWDLAANRNYYGRLNPCQAYVKYANNDTIFKYVDCFIDKFSFQVRESGKLKVNANMIGMDRKQIFTLNHQEVNNTRELTWADAVVTLFTSDFQVGGEYIRHFDASVSNNCQRYFTGGNKGLKVRDISPRVRDIEGTIGIMGRHIDLANYSINNPNRYKNVASINFGYETNCGRVDEAIWTAKIPGVVYMIEELNLSNEIFETIVKWKSAPADGVLSRYTVNR
jgi:hypothetical protein